MYAKITLEFKHKLSSIRKLFGKTCKNQWKLCFFGKKRYKFIRIYLFIFYFITPIFSPNFDSMTIGWHLLHGWKLVACPNSEASKRHYLAPKIGWICRFNYFVTWRFPWGDHEPFDVTNLPKTLYIELILTSRVY